MLSNAFRTLTVNVKSKVFNQHQALFHLASINRNESNSTTPSQPAEEQSAPTAADLKLLQDKLSKCENDLLDFKDRYMRALAEAENTRIRMGKQVDDAKIYGIQGFCKDLLEVADILNLAIVNTDPKRNETEAANEQLLSMFNGLVMTEKCLLKIFSKHGLAQIVPNEGDKFNPNFHEAIFRVPLAGKTPGI